MGYYMVTEPISIPWMGPIFLGYGMLIIVPFMMTAAANGAVNNSRSELFRHRGLA